MAGLMVWTTLWLVVAGAGAEGWSPEPLPAKKVIANGWDRPNVARLKANIEVMKTRPLDGSLIYLDPPEMVLASRNAFGPERWDPAWFEPLLADLKSIELGSLGNSFLQLNANPGSVDWFDDPAWVNIVEHWRITARLAKEAGLPGIVFDPEPYTPPYLQFGWRAQAGYHDHTFAEYADKARQRGAEIIAAVAEVYPDLTLLTYFMNSANRYLVQDGRDVAGLESASYGLYPAFIDGWMSAAPPTMRFVDGCESAYMFKTRNQYLEAATAIKSDCLRLVSPENRATYRAQVGVAFGVYLDAYANEPGSKYYLEGGVAKLRENLSNALDVADEYIWLWGEKWHWWPTENARAKQGDWEEALPGIEGVLGFARNPIEWGRQEWAKLDPVAANLFQNGNFQATSVKRADGTQQDWTNAGTPVGWSFWQDTGSTGTPAWDREVGATEPGSGRLTQVAAGCLIQSIEVQPGERYVARAMRRQQGQGQVLLRVRWQTADSKWHAETQDLVVRSAAPTEEWGELFAVVTVPEGAGRLVALLLVSGQETDDDICWFDDAGAYRLP